MLGRIITAVGALAVAVAHGTVFAHPGHGVTPPESPTHWLEPVHFVPVAIVTLGAAVFAWRRARRES